MVSRSGTLTYQIGNVIAQQGFGNSTIVGIGGDPVPGSDFIDIIGLFQDDPETELIVMCGEIGGDAEERAADFIAENVTKPVVAYIAGFTAPPGKTMGHAGAIVSGSRGTAKAKAEALEGKGVRVGRTPTEVAELAVSLLGAARRLAMAPRRAGKALDHRPVRRDGPAAARHPGRAAADRDPAPPLADVPPPERRVRALTELATRLLASMRELLAGYERVVALPEPPAEAPRPPVAPDAPE